MFKELVYNTRSHRAFNEDRKITRDELLSFVDLARHTSYAMNLQPLKFRLVYEKKELDDTLAVTAWGGALPELELPPKGKAPTAFIIICHDTAIAPQSPSHFVDVGIAAQTIMLAACEAGLHGCMLGSAKADGLRAALSLPENVIPVLTIALGDGLDDIHMIDAKNGEIKYFRDENNTHFVPKRPLEEIIL